jgi:periplasmic copper chaperone A
MSSSLRRGVLRGGAVLAAAAVVAVIGAAPAFAHVTAQPGTAEQGGYSVIAFRVPTESDTAGTVALQVTLPTDHPITSVRTTPRPGWTATMTKVPLNPPIESHGRTITEAVQTVTWTAEPGYRIGPGEFAEFPLSLGPLPTDTDRLVLPAVQTYDDGEVVAWDQPPTADGSEPERPAPVVTLTPATDDTHGAAAGSATNATATNATATNTGATDTTARWLGGGGLLVGALGLGVGVGALLRSRRTQRAGS